MLPGFAWLAALIWKQSNLTFDLSPAATWSFTQNNDKLDEWWLRFVKLARDCLQRSTSRLVFWGNEWSWPLQNKMQLTGHRLLRACLPCRYNLFCLTNILVNSVIVWKTSLSVKVNSVCHFAVYLMVNTFHVLLMIHTS